MDAVGLDVGSLARRFARLSDDRQERGTMRAIRRQRACKREADNGRGGRRENEGENKKGLPDGQAFDVVSTFRTT
jgi:hypothetical protein